MIEKNRKLEDTNKSLPYFDLFENLNMDVYKYHLIFEYSDGRHRYELDNQAKFIFYEDCFMIISKDDDRNLYYYEKMEMIELVTFARED